MKYHRQRLCAYLNIGRYIVRVYKQYARIAFFRDTSFVVNGVGAQTVGILYLPLSFGGGILFFYKYHSRKTFGAVIWKEKLHLSDIDKYVL